MAEAEVRAQAAELRQLRAAGLLGVLRSTATPRPVAYTAQDEEGEQVFRPFPAAFKPLKPHPEPPAAVAVAVQRAAAAAQQRGAQASASARNSPVPPMLPGTAVA